MPASHSRTYRSFSPVRPASCALVAGPRSARSLNRPSRSPKAASTVVAAAAVSVRTRPVNSAACCSFMVAPIGLRLLSSRRRDIRLNTVFISIEHRAVRLEVRMGQPATVIGRDRELAALRGALDDAGRGNGRLVLVGGEPGIGKSTVVEAFCDVARARRAPYLWGGGWACD